MSLNGIAFDTTSGVGTGVARFTDTGYPCTDFGKNCATNRSLSIKINPNGNLDPGVPVTWMLEGDGYNLTPDSVICSASDPCNDADLCFASLGLDQTGLDLNLKPVPVKLMTEPLAKFRKFEDWTADLQVGMNSSRAGSRLRYRNSRILQEARPSASSSRQLQVRKEWPRASA